MIFLQLFCTFFIIGAFTFGGGYAMLSLIQNQVVTVHQWLTPEEFTDILWICILFERFKNNPWFASILKIMRPITIGMIAAAAIILITPYNFIDWWSWALFAAAFIALLLKANPIWIIIAAGGAGYLIYG